MLNKLSIDNLPNHIALIPDGNRRWAKSRGLNTWKGHRQGINNLEEILDVVLKLKIKFFSFWGASLDNVDKRPKLEVMHLMNLFREKFISIANDKKIHDNQIHINVLGKWKEKFPRSVSKAIEKAIYATKNYHRHFLNFFLAYNGTDEMLETIKEITVQAQKDRNLKITPEVIKNNLFTANLPSVDYIIRTGGEPHNSVGFMMWDSADAQYYFSDKLFPDFHADEFVEALKDYDNRIRRFGK